MSFFKKTGTLNTWQHLATLAILTTVATAGCTKKDIQYGGQFVDGQYTQIIQLDSLTPTLSTVYTDSFATADLGTALLGYISDTAVGDLTMSSYFELAPPSYSGTATTYDNATLDSVCLVMRLDSGKYAGDTTLPFQVGIYQLKEQITPGTDETLYNHDSFLAETTPLATGSKILRPDLPGTADSMSIRMSDNFGQQLLDLLIQKNIAIQSVNQFLPYFKGLKIAPTSQNKIAYGFKDSIELRVYYKTPGLPEATQHTAVFSLNDATHQFNHIDINRKGSLAAAGISLTNPVISSGSSGHNALLQSLAGYMIKIQFPSIGSLVQRAGFLQIIAAKLYLQPTDQGTLRQFALPTTLNLFTTDLNNGFGSQLTDNSGSALSGNLVIDYQNTSGLGTYYSFDITSYLSTLMRDNTAGSLKKGLLLTGPYANRYDSFNRLQLGDANAAKGKATLKIQYLSVQ
jgi:hypothetical protein